MMHYNKAEYLPGRRSRGLRQRRGISNRFIAAILLSTLFFNGVTDNAAVADTFRDGETVCFLGDSITHYGRYHSIIYAYYLTRFPDRTVHFINAGIAGDTASGSLGRLRDDVTSKLPTTIVVMFGMNDVNRNSYVAHPTEQHRKAQTGALDRYETNMDILLERLSKETSARFILMTPSPYDQTCAKGNENHPGCNDGLGRCAEIVRRLAPKYNAEVVDLHGPMTAFNLKRQEHDPNYTLIGGDRVHPGIPGHLMMAWLFLKTQAAPALVSKVQLDASTGQVVESENATVTNVRRQEDGLAFTVLEKALPCPLANGLEMLEHISFEKDLNQEILQIKGLANGEYSLLIDNVIVATHTESEWAAGVNLAFNRETPQVKQAEKVLQTNENRYKEELRLRNYAAVRKFLQFKQIDPDDLAAVRTFSETKMNKTGYFEKLVPTYLNEWPHYTDVVAKVAAMEQEAMKLRVPVSHDYEIRPMCDPANPSKRVKTPG